MKIFDKNGQRLKPHTIFYKKISITDVWQRFKYAFAYIMTRPIFSFD